jgi:tricorn protease
VQEGVTTFNVSHNGEKMIVGQGFGPATRFTIMPTMTPPRPGEGVLNLADMEVYIDPKAEWRQMYEEAWRIQRDFFYDPGLHGLDYAGTKKKYEVYLDCRRAPRGFELPLPRDARQYVGRPPQLQSAATRPIRTSCDRLAGCDYKVENGRYRFAKIYNGENWNPQLRAPLTQPGVEVNEVIT